MQIQVNTESRIDGREALIERVEGKIASVLSRFSDRITRVEVHLGDVNADKAGPSDKRCSIEARVAHQQPVAVGHFAATLDEACAGAAEKLRHLLDSRFGRLDAHKGAASIRHTEVE